MTNTNPSKGTKDYFAALAFLPWWLQWLIFTLLSLALYAPILGNSFLSDDFLVIKKLVIDERLNTNGFFRPLSDMTIWLNYQIGKLNPFNYYLFGIIMRGLSTVFLFRLCIRLTGSNMVALLAALIFITYPFHNESVAWILGRGALMAGTFALAALLIMTGEGKEVWKIVGACCCYFAGLAAYETIVVLPLMVLVYMLFNKKPAKLIVAWQFFLLLTLVVYIILRVAVSGSLLGEYGSEFVKNDPLNFISNVGKVAARLIVPPVNDPVWFTILSVAAVVAVIVVLVLLWRKKSEFYLLVAFLLAALLIPFWAGVSTRTSESDRFLELPSAFWAMLLSFAIFHLFKNPVVFRVVLLVVLAFQITFLQLNNHNWRLASRTVREIIYVAEHKRPGQRMMIVNLPGDIKGAYVFRNGLTDALVLAKVDTAVTLIEAEDVVNHRYGKPGDAVIHYKKQD